MHKAIKLVISIVILLAFAVLLVSLGSVPVQGSGATPRNAEEAIAAALGDNPELADLKIRESYAFNKLKNARRDPVLSLDASTAEHLSELHEVWARFETGSADIVAEVLSTIMAIDTESTRQRELGELMEDMAGWIDTAEQEFRTAKIDADVLNNLKTMREQIRSNHAASVLRMQSHMNRYRELTGHGMSDRFDYESAWLLVDVGKVDTDRMPEPRPVMVFSKASGLISPPRDRTSKATMVNDARLVLISLHEAVLNYEKMDKLVETLEFRFMKGEVSKYMLYDAIGGRVLSAIAVYDYKYAYAVSMLAIDKASNGLVSSRYREESARWFSDNDKLFDGRYNVAYDWMKFIGGKWQLERTRGSDGKVAWNVSSFWFSRGDPTRVALFYNDKKLAEGRVKETLTFNAPSYSGTTLIKAVFYNDKGTELYYAYIDGFANAGRFFDIDPLPQLGTPSVTDGGDGTIVWSGVENVGYLQEYKVEYRLYYFDAVTERWEWGEVKEAGRTGSTSFDYLSFLANSAGGTYEFRVTALSFDTNRCLDSDESVYVPIVYTPPPPPPPPCDCGTGVCECESGSCECADCGCEDCGVTDP